LGSTVADPRSADPGDLTFSWTVARDGVFYTSGSGPGFSFTPTSAGIYVVTLTVTNVAGKTSLATTASITVDSAATAVGANSASGSSSPGGLPSGALDVQPAFEELHDSQSYARLARMGAITTLNWLCWLSRGWQGMARGLVNRSG
jgi:hypothetical protein